MTDPLRDMLTAALLDDPVVTGSAGPCVDPVRSSIRTRHKFIAPPRSLEKKRYCPSGDHTGFQLMNASCVTGAGGPPSADTVQILRSPFATAQYAMRFPFGDQLGWTASIVVSCLRFWPVSTSTVQSTLWPRRVVGTVIRSVAKTTCF